ncbi:MAG: hypothetical protein MJZ72_04435 [Bacteroidales bacterium]|nr:hypothetical protein [Bacteroidales bacterium]
MKKLILLFFAVLTIVGIYSCKKSKCAFFDDKISYYQKSLDSWSDERINHNINDTVYYYQLSKIDGELKGLIQHNQVCDTMSAVHLHERIWSDTVFLHQRELISGVGK